MVAPSSVGIKPACGSTPVAAGAVAAVLSFSAEAAGQANPRTLPAVCASTRLRRSLTFA